MPTTATPNRCGQTYNCTWSCAVCCYCNPNFHVGDGERDCACCHLVDSCTTKDQHIPTLAEQELIDDAHTLQQLVADLCYHSSVFETEDDPVDAIEHDDRTE